MKADVAEVCRTEQSVAECVDNHVGIAVSVGSASNQRAIVPARKGEAIEVPELAPQ